MAYKDFNSMSDVCDMFDCDVVDSQFVEEKKIEVHPVLMEFIQESFHNQISFKNEYVICERIISPILNIVSKNSKLPVWSHVPFNVDEQLSGTPDYLFALARRGGDEYKLPIACLGEAKKDIPIQKTYGQVAAEMIAAQKNNKNPDIPIFGLITSGTVWLFLKLEGNLFTKDDRMFSATRDIDEVFNVLNWFLCEARKAADILLEIEAKEKLKKEKK